MLITFISSYFFFKKRKFTNENLKAKEMFSKIHKKLH